MKYYAVKKGYNKGIYTTWQECQEQTRGFSGALFKSFTTMEEATEYLEANEEAAPINSNLPFAYIDGSFKQSAAIYGYGGYLSVNDKIYILQGSGNDAKYLKYRNITGEIRGALEVIKITRQMQLTELNLYYDYAGIKQWALGNWNCENELTQFYKAYYDKYAIKINFIHIKGHTGNEGNELADLLAKEAVGAKLRKKDFILLEQFKQREEVQ